MSVLIQFKREYLKIHATVFGAISDTFVLYRIIYRVNYVCTRNERNDGKRIKLREESSFLWSP